MRFLGSFMAVAVFLACLVTTGHAAEQTGTAKAQPLGTFQVKVSKDNLSLDANQAPLVQIFQEIGKQAKITFDSNIGPEEKITIHLDRVPLEEGIKQLAKNVTVFYTENPKDKTRRITRVVVLSEGKEGASHARKPKRSPQPVKVKKPAPQPEPFKFEFDPAKSAQRRSPASSRDDLKNTMINCLRHPIREHFLSKAVLASDLRSMAFLAAGYVAYSYYPDLAQTSRPE